MYKEKFDLFNQEDGPEKTAARHPERQETEDDFDPARPVKEGEFPLPKPLQEIEDEKSAQAEADNLLRQIEEDLAEKHAAAVDKRTPAQKYWDKVFPPKSDPENDVKGLEELQQIIERGPQAKDPADEKTDKRPIVRKKKWADWPDFKSRQYKDND